MSKKAIKTTLNNKVVNFSDLTTKQQQVLYVITKYLLEGSGRFRDSSFAIVKSEYLINELGGNNQFSKLELVSTLKSLKSTVWISPNGEEKENIFSQLYIGTGAYLFSLTKSTITKVVSLREDTLLAILGESYKQGTQEYLKKLSSNIEDSFFSNPLKIETKDIPIYLKLNSLDINLDVVRLYSKLDLGHKVTKDLFTGAQCKQAKVLSFTFPINYVMHFLDARVPLPPIEDTLYEYSPNKLNRAVNLINEHSNKKITFLEIKDNNIITHIQFYIHLSDEVPTFGLFM